MTITILGLCREFCIENLSPAFNWSSSRHSLCSTWLQSYHRFRFIDEKGTSNHLESNEISIKSCLPRPSKYKIGQFSQPSWNLSCNPSGLVMWISFLLEQVKPKWIGNNSIYGFWFCNKDQDPLQSFYKSPALQVYREKLSLISILTESVIYPVKYRAPVFHLVLDWFPWNPICCKLFPTISKSFNLKSRARLTVVSNGWHPSSPEYRR